MAYKGKRITNPYNKQTIEFLRTAKDSAGLELEMKSTWEPFSMKPAPHFHPHQDEVFTVLEGELSLQLNGKTVLLFPGESIQIPAKAIHSMWNNSAAKTVVNWKVFPAYNTEYLLETGVGLAMDGKINKNGMPGILQVALLGEKYRKEFRLGKPSYMLQRLAFWLLTPFALLNGKRAFYPKYID